MIGQNPPVYIMQVYTVLIHTKHCWGMERETESITQATNTLILKSLPENKNCCPHPAQDQNILKKPVTLILIQH